MIDSLHRGSDHALVRAIDAVVSEPRLSLALRRADDLRECAARAARPTSVARCLAEVVREGDDVSSLAAIHAIGAVADPLADHLLTELVLDGSEPYAAHAAWSLAARRPRPAGAQALLRLALAGGFPAMLAERTLVEWTRNDPSLLGDVADAGMRLTDWEDRSRLARLYGAMSDVGLPTLGEMGVFGGDVAMGEGVVVVQPCLHARIDRDGSTLGVGDSGGVASLLRSLGPTLAEQPSVSDVITVTRSASGEARSETIAAGHRVVRLAVGPDGPLPSREAWQYRIDVERQLLALGNSLAGRRVVWHLRMADVGTLAAASVARRLGQPVVFTAVPDPHIVLDALQDSGRLGRDRFGVEDAAHQYWFRSRLVERVARQAEHLVLLPRPTIRTELAELVGLDDAFDEERAIEVPEGVDVAAADRARAARLDGPGPAVRKVLSSMPEERRGLPWLLTVGRLHPSKGAHRLVAAVAGDPVLSAAVNVVVVGGNLAQPNADEQSTIERIRGAARDAPARLVTLAGNLPPHDVAALLAHVAASGGTYVCASDKEEFGLAIVEALAAGAVVVVPRRGGPQTYVADGDTGVVCDTSSVTELHDGIVRARTLEAVPGRASRARDMVRTSLSIERMAVALAGVYCSASSVRTNA